jgi:LysM repeat protein
MLEQKNRNRARFKTAFFCVLAIHIIPITLALLMQGCRRQDASAPEPVVETNTWTEPTNYPDTNLVATNPTTYTPPAEPVSVPSYQPGSQEYIVAKGDVFETIAKKFPGVTSKQIQEANPTVQPTKMRIGQKLIIPAPAPAAQPAGTAVDATASGEQIYVVKSGDTLSKIATDHGTTVKALRAANNLTSDRIVVGKKLKIPAGTSAPAPATAPADATPSAAPPAAPTLTPPPA